MWRRLRNLFVSLKTYSDFSPDLSVRRRVTQCLCTRPDLNAEEWYRTFWQSKHITKSVIDFVYIHLSNYSGISFSRVHPSDRLNEDLFLPLICWFDWEQALCEDILTHFGVDLSNCLDLSSLTTVEDLVLFLNHHITSLDRLPLRRRE